MPWEEEAGNNIKLSLLNKRTIDYCLSWISKVVPISSLLIIWVSFLTHKKQTIKVKYNIKKKNDTNTISQ